MATLLEQVEVDTELRPAIAGRNPWALAARRLWRNRIAMAALLLFLVIVVMCLSAPLYAHDVAHVNPFLPNLNGHTVVNGKVVPLMQRGGGVLRLGETPIGPTWDPSHYFLGADSTGRDVAALLLYGGRGLLIIGVGAPGVFFLAGTPGAPIPRFFGGVTDSGAAPHMDIILAFPGYLLAL